MSESIDTALELMGLLNELPALTVTRRVVGGKVLCTFSLCLLAEGIAKDYVVARGETVNEAAAKLCSQLLAKLESRLDACASSGALESARRIRECLKGDSR